MMQLAQCTMYTFQGCVTYCHVCSSEKFSLTNLLIRRVNKKLTAKSFWLLDLIAQYYNDSQLWILTLPLWNWCWNDLRNIWSWPEHCLQLSLLIELIVALIKSRKSKFSLLNYTIIMQSEGKFLHYFKVVALRAVSTFGAKIGHLSFLIMLDSSS